MLTQLIIQNFAIVHHLEIDFQAGMSAITGETGAGKSIAIDALGLCLGNRCEGAMVKHNADRADISARFTLHDTPQAKAWLIDHQLDDQQECLLRRTINSDGRSRAYINGNPVPVSQLRELSTLLIQIHGQHAHQLLLKADHQRALLDAFLDNLPLLDSMRNAYHRWHKAKEQLHLQEQFILEQEARVQLLQYQLKELNEFAPVEGEYEQIDAEYKCLANGGEVLLLSQQAVELLSDNEESNIVSLLRQVQHHVNELIAIDPKLSSVQSMLDNAMIQIDEAGNELRYYAQCMEVDPQRQNEIEQRLAKQLTLARKHRVRPEELPLVHQQLLSEYQELQQQEDSITQLTDEVARLQQQAQQQAVKVYNARKKHADALSKLVTQSIQHLAMPYGHFTIEVNHNSEQLTALGADRVTFLVTTNPGQPLQPLNKVVSGGELSRIALAIQVITAEKMDTPALIFDEVDTGISGPTAAVVGGLLKQLGKTTQVMCVTHLPQVAGAAHHQFMVNKYVKGDETETQMQCLNEDERILELARLLGGSSITENTLANAKELLVQQ